MGARLVRACLKVDKVRPRAWRVLVTMAVLTLDSDRGNKSAGVYYGGRYMLMGELGIWPTPSSERELKRDIHELIEAGLLERLEGAHVGKAAVYRLCITPL